ncbi:MAG: hypothetical protein LUD39_04150 [Opitutae bacterium]|nr:hypothetical protein [Opitutae bacterium]
MTRNSRRQNAACVKLFRAPMTPAIYRLALAASRDNAAELTSLAEMLARELEAKNELLRASGILSASIYFTSDIPAQIAAKIRF